MEHLLFNNERSKNFNGSLGLFPLLPDLPFDQLPAKMFGREVISSSSCIPTYGIQTSCVKIEGIEY